MWLISFFLVLVLESEREWNEALDEGAPVLIKFTAKWCQPCKRLAPLYSKLAAQEDFITSGVRFMEVDVDNKSLASVKNQCGVSPIPAMQLWCKGKKVDEFVGFFPNKLTALANKAKTL